MSTSPVERTSPHVGQEKLLAFVRTMLGGSVGRENDEHSLPPGRWQSTVRAALERIDVFGPQPEPWKVFGPSPEPWFGRKPVFGYPVPWMIAFAHFLARHTEISDAIGGGGHGSVEKLALNPQPLPPRFAFLLALAREVVGRAELLQEIADATPRHSEPQGRTLAGNYIDLFSDELCPIDFRLRWPFPWPHPNWFVDQLGGIDLVVIATQFDKASKEAFSPDLRRDLANASAKFVGAGLSRMH